MEQQEFQIPQQLRELAEKNVEQARVAYGHYGMAEAVRAWSTVPIAGSLFVAFVDFGAARTTRSFAYQLSMWIDQDHSSDPFFTSRFPKFPICKRW